MKKIIVTILAAMFAFALFGCAAKPELIPKSTANQARVDLTGNWELRDESGTPVTKIGAAEQGIHIPRRSSQRRPQRRERATGTAVHVFLETGKRLKITQTEHGLFVSFDRAVVEEYTFGENRTISVGPIEAQRVSGWEGLAFVVETLDDDGAVLAESWELDESGNELTREISVVARDKVQVSARQVFDRT